MKYNVATFRTAGLEAHWTKTRTGQPIIAARAPGKATFYVVTGSMFKAMEQHGVREGFDQHTLLGDFFSIPA